MARRHRKYDPVQPWWLRDIGGMPGWAVAAVFAVLAAIGVFIALNLPPWLVG